MHTTIDSHHHDHAQDDTNDHTPTRRLKELIHTVLLRIDEGDHQWLQTFDHWSRQTVVQLRREARTSGVQLFWRMYHRSIYVRKQSLMDMMLTYRFLGRMVHPVQASVRGWLQRRRLLRNHGPAWRTRSLCVNDSDFTTLDPIASIPVDEFVSYQDEHGIIYGFHIRSLLHWVHEHEPCINPYTRALLPYSLLNHLMKWEEAAHIEEVDNTFALMTDTQRLHLQTVEWFAHMDSFGYYTNPMWYLALSPAESLAILAHLQRLWVFYLNADMYTRLCPPDGMWIADAQVLPAWTQGDATRVKLWVAQYLMTWIMRADSHESMDWSVMYVLASLTFVSMDAAWSLPWLNENFALPPQQLL